MNSKNKIEFDFISKAGLLLQYPELEEGFQKRQFSISDVGVTTRIVNHWESEGLLTPNKGGKHRRFSLEEYVWLKIILKLKKFDVKLPVIRELGRQLLKVQDMNKMVQDKGVREQLIGLLGGQKTGIEEGQLEQALHEILSNDLIKTALSQISMSYLGLLIRDAILIKNHISILINEKGEASPFKEIMAHEYFNNPDFLEFSRSTYISVSLTEILKEFISDHTAHAHGTFGLITEDEFKLLDTLKQEGIKSVKVKLDGAGKMKFMEVSKSKPVPTKQDIIEAILTSDYASLRVEVENGKPQIIENTRKIKL